MTVCDRQPSSRVEGQADAYEIPSFIDGYDPDLAADELAGRVFSRLDLNGDGSLSVDELSQALAHLGLSETQQEEQVRNIARKRPMDRDAFKKFCRKRLRIMRQLFYEIDTNQTNTISFESIRGALHRIGLQADRSKIERLIGMIDTGGDGKITFSQFYSALLMLPSTSVDDLFQNWDRASLCDLGESSSIIPQHREPKAFATSALIAGAIAGIISRTITAPLDRLKLILQADKSPLSMRGSLLSSFRRIYREGGIRGLFRGNLVNVIKVAPENAIKMWAFDHLGGFDSQQERSPPQQFAVGALAGAISQSIIYPLETIKTNFALSRAGQYPSLFHCSNQIYHAHGFPGFYRGLAAATCGIIPYAGVDLSLFAFFKRSWEVRYPHHNPSAFQLLGFGALSSTCGQLIAYPFQLVRTRLQSQGMPGRAIVYTGAIDCFRQTIQQDGVRGLYRGMQPNFFKALPSISISYAIYDLTYRHLEQSAIK